MLTLSVTAEFSSMMKIMAFLLETHLTTLPE